MNSSEFANKFTREEKQILRQTRVCDRKMEMILDEYAVGFGPVAQFDTDCKLYGIYKACLYALNGVDSGHMLHGVGQALERELRKRLDKPAKKVAAKRKSKFNIDDLI